MKEKKPLEEVIREDMQKTLEAQERKLVQMTAEGKLSSSRKYVMMLSWQTMIIVALIGTFAVGCLIANGFHNLKLMNDRAAYFDWGFAAVLGVVVIIWIARSVVLQKQYKADLESYVSSGQAKLDFDKDMGTMELKKAENVTIRYPIEVFERLSDDEMSLAEDEWDEFLLFATDRFYRMGFMTHAHEGELYQVFIELRYQELGDLNINEMDSVEERIEDGLEELQEHDPVTQAREFKEDVKDLIRKVLAERFPYFRADEICIAVRKIS
ncbi:MAG: hypothetical protein K6F51_07030 [Acetatifactor sp.]|nr:hypothetical protein [Acetatifactor sp.]